MYVPPEDPTWDDRLVVRLCILCGLFFLRGIFVVAEILVLPFLDRLQCRHEAAAQVARS